MSAELKPLISVIMNCYNSETYLKDAILSVLNQKFTDWELIFWDNQSKDASAHIAQSFSDKRLHYFYAPQHTTLGEARNLAVQKARGEWVAFLDCDDLWTSDKLEKQVELIKHSDKKLGLVYARAKIMGGKYDGRELAAEYINKALPEGRILQEYLLSENFIPLLAALVRRDLFWEVGGIPPDFKQSEDFYLFAAIAVDYEVKAVQDVCCFYRMHDQNISNVQKELACIESIRILNTFWPTLPEAKKYAYKKNKLVNTYNILLGIFGIRTKKAIFSGLMPLLRHPLLTSQIVLTHYKRRFS